MKKQLVAIALIAGMSAGNVFAIDAAKEAATPVYNKGDRPIFYIWRSANNPIMDLISSARSDRWVVVMPGKKVTLGHTGDKIDVLSFKCENGKIVEMRAEKKAETRGYRKVEVTPSDNGIEISKF